MTTMSDRILQRVVVDESGCWIWQGYLNPVNGYGYLYRPEPRGNCIAHRISYEEFVEEIPPGHDIDHLCRVRACVNPAHLEAVTRGENNRRARTPEIETHCRRRHPFNPENTYTRPNGERQCKACRLARQRRWRQQQTAREAQS